MAQADEILTYKNQLNEFLTRKFPDLSLLIGFNTLLQSKFQSWITSDLNEYFSSIESGNVDAHFKTMKYLETIWNEFHYPTIKFFQHQHHVLYQEAQESFKKCQLEGKANQFKVKPVEMRKINDNFIKFIKQIFQFYLGLLKYFTTKFSNSFIPQNFLDHFSLKIPENVSNSQDNNFQANVLYLIHRCVLSLGDICRHQTFVELTYVQPVISNKEFFKFRSLTTLEKTQKFLPRYYKAIQYYKYCIMLLPALNEPYNHIGMIYNLVDDKFHAIYWFLRSQFTRIPDYKLGLSNLNNVLKKHWFITALVDVVNENKERQFKVEDSLNIYLICLMGYFYYPQQYKSGPNLVKKLTFSKIESDFFKCLSNNFSDLIDKVEENFILTQLTVLFSFTELCKSKSDDYDKVVRFTFRYLEKILDYLRHVEFKGSKFTNVCIITRFILNWLKENKSLYLIFESRKQSILGVVNIINKFIEVSDKSILSQSNRPIRSYYFWEDVHFRDFKLIKYQFKDFKDDELFKVNNINFLVGDYLELVKNKTPTFLTKEKQTYLVDNPKEIDHEIEIYENNLRIHALIILGKRLLFASTSFEVTLEESNARFLVKDKVKNSQEKKPKERKEIKESSSPTPQKASSKKQKSSPTPTPEEIPIPPVKVPVSLEEIESFITKHTHELKSGIEIAKENVTADETSEEPELKLHNMVDSLVGDDDNKEVVNISPRATLNNSIQNIWKHEPIQESQPKFLDSFTQPIPQVPYPTTNFSQYFYPQMPVYPPSQSQPFPSQSGVGHFQHPIPPVFAPHSQPIPQQGFPQQPPQPMFSTFPMGPEAQKNIKQNKENENGNTGNSVYPQYFNS